MKLTTQIQAPDESKNVVERLLQENLDKKLKSYLQRYEWESVTGEVKIKVEKNKKSLFNGILQIHIDGNNFRYEREDYKNLDDLVNNLCDHFKEELASHK